MSQVTVESAHKHHDHTVTVTVNKHPVRLTHREATGLQIKQAAIAQGVRIELDFVLSELREHRPAQVIGDTDIVRITEHSRFSAVAGDDNS
jgi:hypothetical protein